jgi:hypothetical protein
LQKNLLLTIDELLFLDVYFLKFLQGVDHVLKVGLFRLLELCCNQKTCAAEDIHLLDIKLEVTHRRKQKILVEYGTSHEHSINFVVPEFLELDDHLNAPRPLTFRHGRLPQEHIVAECRPLLLHPHHHVVLLSAIVGLLAFLRDLTPVFDILELVLAQAFGVRAHPSLHHDLRHDVLLNANVQVGLGNRRLGRVRMMVLRGTVCGPGLQVLAAGLALVVMVCGAFQVQLGEVLPAFAVLIDW